MEILGDFFFFCESLVLIGLKVARGIRWLERNVIRIDEASLQETYGTDICAVRNKELESIIKESLVSLE